MDLSTAFQDWPKFAHAPEPPKRKEARREKRRKEWIPNPRPTVHALTRIKQRLGLKGAEAENQVRRAFWKGMMNVDCYGDLLLWLERLQRKRCCGNATRIWRNHAFLFENDILVTVIPVPKNFR